MMQNIVKQAYNLECKIKKKINTNKPIPPKLEAMLNQAHYTLDRLSEIVKVYKGSYE